MTLVQAPAAARTFRTACLMKRRGGHRISHGGRLHGLAALSRPVRSGCALQGLAYQLQADLLTQSLPVSQGHPAAHADTPSRRHDLRPTRITVTPGWSGILPKGSMITECLG